MSQHHAITKQKLATERQRMDVLDARVTDARATAIAVEERAAQLEEEAQALAKENSMLKAENAQFKEENSD
jgi:hypothetical protein